MLFSKMATATEVMKEIGSNSDDKTFFITGSNNGLGYFVAETLLKQRPGPKLVVMACRNIAKAESAKKRLLDSTNANEDQIAIVQVDLSDLASIAAMKVKIDKIDCLINNAGIQALPKYTASAQGYELQYAVNHLGHFYLTQRLLPLLKKATSPRVVTISSKSHTQFAVGNAEDAIRPQTASNYGAWSSYGNSKLCNVAFAKGLQARHLDLNCYSVHPGWVMENSGLWDPVKNNLYSWAHPAFKFIISIVRGVGSIFTTDIKSMEQGISTILVCALEDSELLVNGGYYEDCNIANPRSDIDEKIIDMLWKGSEEKINEFEKNQS